MSPRAYNLGKRQEQISQVRARVLAAARDLLGGSDSYAGFTLDAIARRADVARATVYYQFGSKAGLLEALCDHLAELGGLGALPAAFSDPDPDAALAAFVEAFGQFWQADRAVMRRLRALAALDPEVEKVIRSRDLRRRTGIGVLVGRLAERKHVSADLDRERATRTLTMLTSFETFDALAETGQDLRDVAPAVLALARAVFAV